MFIMVQSDKNQKAQVVEQSAEQEERGYVINKGMPRFVGDVEIKRLRKVVDEKNAAIEAFKKYDEERKAYYAGLTEEYEEMKSSFTQFNEELLKVVQDGDMSQSEYKRFMKLYGHWLTYKNNANLYKNVITTAKQGVKDLIKDLNKLEVLVLNAGDMTLIEQLTDRIHVMHQHLDTVRSRLVTDE